MKFRVFHIKSNNTFNCKNFVMEIIFELTYEIELFEGKKISFYEFKYWNTESLKMKCAKITFTVSVLKNIQLSSSEHILHYIDRWTIFFQRHFLNTFLDNIFSTRWILNQVFSAVYCWSMRYIKMLIQSWRINLYFISEFRTLPLISSEAKIV